MVVDGHARGIIVRNLQTGEVTRHSADAVVLATGGYGNVFNLSTYARGFEYDSDLACRTAGARVSPTLSYTPDPSDLAFPSVAITNRS